MYNPVPAFIQRQYQDNQFQGSLTGAAMVMDMAGFTAMTQQLMTHGKAGAEVLAETINEIFEPIIYAVYAQDGFITTFAGDSFTAIFPGETAVVVPRAWTTARLIQHSFARVGRQHTPLGDFSLSVRLGISAGEVDWGIIGPEAHKSYFFRGPALTRCAQAERLAQAGEIVVDERLVSSLPAQVQSGLQPVVEHFVRPVVPAAAGPPLQPIGRALPPERPIPADFFDPAAFATTGQGEFRDVAALFVSFAEPLAWSRLVDFVTIVITLADRFGGYFNKLDFGDKGGMILILFGAPTAHENDIDRALNFLLALREGESETLGTENDRSAFWRAGVTYGRTYAGYVGVPLRGEYTVLGASVNLAARLMMHAHWGEVLMSPEMTRHQGFDAVHIGDLSFKGIRRLVATYRLQGRRSLEQKVFSQRLIGRENEVAALVDFTRPLLDGRFAGFALIHGEAGIGKSHLAYAFQQALGIRAGQWESVEKGQPATSPQWFTGQCDQILHQPLNPFVYWLRRYFEQSTRADLVGNKRAFTQRLDSLRQALVALPDERAAGLAEELGQLESFLGALLGLHWPDSLYERVGAQARYENSLTAIKKLLLAESCRRPVIFELEDAHWLDDASHEMVTRLSRNMAGYPLLFVITSRYLDKGQKLALSLNAETPIFEIDLNTLSPQALRQLAQHLLGSDIDDALYALLLEKTEAQPFFAQQMIYYFQENHLLVQNEAGRWHLATRTFDLPAGINAVLIARIDRLNSQIKEVVQTAAVLGREFEVQILSHILDTNSLPNVRRAEQAQVWSALDELHYIFRHVLLRDVAYEMQLGNHLRHLHRLAARAYEQIHDTDLGSYYADLAYHYGLAGEDEKEYRYALLAGRQAFEQYMHQEALRFFNRALALTAVGSPDDHYRLLLDRQQIYHLQGDREKQLQDLQALEGFLARHRGHTHIVLWQGEVALQWADYGLATGDYPLAIAHARQVLETVAKRQAPDITAQAYLRLGESHHHQGQVEQARQCYLQALDLARQEALPRWEAYSLNRLAILLREQNDLALGASYHEQALAIFEQLNDLNGMAQAANNLGVLKMHQGDEVASASYYHRSLALKTRIGDRLGEGLTLNNLGRIAERQRNYALARRYYQRSLTIKREIGDIRGEGGTLINLGNVCLRQGDYAGTIDCYGQAVAINQAIGHVRDEAIGTLNLSYMYSLLGNYQAAYELGRRSLELTEQSKIQMLVGYAWNRQGYALAGLNRLQEAREAYEQAMAIRQAMQTEALLCETQAGLAHVHLLLGDEEAAFQLIEPVIDYVLTDELKGVDDPLRLYWHCYQVLLAHGSEQADELLHTAYDLLQSEAQKIDEPERLADFFTAVVTHRDIMAAYGVSEQDSAHE